MCVRATWALKALIMYVRNALSSIPRPDASDSTPFNLDDTSLMVLTGATGCTSYHAVARCTISCMNHAACVKLMSLDMCVYNTLFKQFSRFFLEDNMLYSYQFLIISVE